MTVLRINKRYDRFVTLTTKVLNLSTLSWEAKGLWAYLMARPKEWEPKIKHLENEFPKAKREKLCRMFDDLVEHGLCTKHQERQTNGRMGTFIYTVYDEIQIISPQSEKPLTAEPRAVNPTLINIDNKKDRIEETTGSVSPPGRTSPEVEEIKKILQKKLRTLKSDRKPIADAQVKRYLQPLVNRHKNTPEIVKKVICWIFDSDHPKAVDFWRCVIQGPKSLYTNFDQIVVQMNHKTIAQKESDAKEEKTKYIEENRRWAKSLMQRVNFPSIDRKMAWVDNYLAINVEGRRGILRYDMPNFKNDVINKLKSWGVFP